MSMIMKFQKVELQEDKTYPAKITKLEIDRVHERVRIWVSLRRYNHVVNGKYFSINFGNYFSIITGILFSIFFNPHGLLRGSAAY